MADKGEVVAPVVVAPVVVPPMKVTCKVKIVDVQVTKYTDPVTGKPVKLLKVTLMYPDAPVGSDANRTSSMVMVLPGDYDIGTCEPGQTSTISLY